MYPLVRERLERVRGYPQRAERDAARDELSEAAFEYVVGGAEAEATVRRNRVFAEPDRLQQEWFENLHPRDQTLASMAGYLSGYDIRRMQEVLRPRMRRALEEKGLTIIDASKAQRNQMRSQVQEPALQVVRERVTDTSWVKGLFDATEKAKSDLGFK